MRFGKGIDEEKMILKAAVARSILHRPPQAEQLRRVIHADTHMILLGCTAELYFKELVDMVIAPIQSLLIVLCP